MLSQAPPPNLPVSPPAIVLKAPEPERLRANLPAGLTNLTVPASDLTPASKEVSESRQVSLLDKSMDLALASLPLKTVSTPESLPTQTPLQSCSSFSGPSLFASLPYNTTASSASCSSSSSSSSHLHNDFQIELVQRTSSDEPIILQQIKEQLPEKELLAILKQQTLPQLTLNKLFRRAVKYNYSEEVLKELISQGADVNSISTKGKTAEIIAAENDNLPIYIFLKDNGAQDTADNDGLTPLCYAAKKPDGKVFKYLANRTEPHFISLLRAGGWRAAGALITYVIMKNLLPYLNAELSVVVDTGVKIGLQYLYERFWQKILHCGPVQRCVVNIDNTLRKCYRKLPKCRWPCRRRSTT
ncbi:MAG: hypothetical protein RLZ12_260 [Bacillota bacterium]|jgi:hypothetical protein